MGENVILGYMTEEEFEIYAAVDVSINKFWIPMTWFLFLVKEARSHGIIKDNIAVKHIVEVKRVGLPPFRNLCLIQF